MSQPESDSPRPSAVSATYLNPHTGSVTAMVFAVDGGRLCLEGAGPSGESVTIAAAIADITEVRSVPSDGGKTHLSIRLEGHESINISIGDGDAPGVIAALRPGGER